MDKKVIAPIAHVASSYEVRSWLVDALTARHITRRQFTALAMLAERHVPCQVALLHRSPKSTVYLHINGELEYRVGPRSEMYGGQHRPIE